MFCQLRLPPPKLEQLDVAAQRVLGIAGPPSWWRALLERVEKNATAVAANVSVVHGRIRVLAEPCVDEEGDGDR